MKLETERLNLLPMSLEDHKFFHDTNIDGFVRKYLWDDDIISPDMSRDILKTIERHFKEDNWGLWKIVVKDTDLYIGYVGLWKFHEENQPQLLYATHREYAGIGYAFEATHRLICHVFESLEFPFLVASMDIENKKSIKLCERLGFSFVEQKNIDGKLTHYYKLYNTLQ